MNLENRNTLPIIRSTKAKLWSQLDTAGVLLKLLY